MEGEFIHNPDGIGGHCHSACLAEHQGKLLATWYGYQEKEYEKGQICLSEYNDETKSWGRRWLPFPNLHMSSCGNPVLFSNPVDGTLHLFFVILQHHYWDSAQIYHSYRQEEHGAWTSPEKINLPLGTMVRHRPYMDSSGKILIPAYDEGKNQTVIYSSSFPFNQWDLVSEIEGTLIQGDLIFKGNEEFQIFLRPAGDTPHYIFRALSPDGGRNFTTVLRTTLSCPLTGLAAIQLDTGDTLVCHNDTEEFKRSPISLSLVKKGEVIFNHLFHLDTGDLELSYPNMIQRSNGEIHLVYTYNRKMIKHVFLSPTTRGKHGF